MSQSLATPGQPSYLPLAWSNNDIEGCQLAGAGVAVFGFQG